MFSIEYDRTSNVFVAVNVGAKNRNFNVPLILNKYNIMIAMQKLKFMQAKLPTRACARSKHAKTCFCSIKMVLKAQSSGKLVCMMHKNDRYRSIIYRNSQNPGNDRKIKTVKFLFFFFVFFVFFLFFSLLSMFVSLMLKCIQ